MFKSRSSRGFIRQKFHRNSGGFTIIEVMIFLAVSLGVFGVAVVNISRQNAETAFAQSVRDVELQLQDVFNDLESGYYPPNNFSCSQSGASVAVGPGGEQQGSNEDCIFIGKAVQLGPGGELQEMDISTIIGRRQAGSPPKEVSSLSEAGPKLLEDELAQPKDKRYTSAEVEFRRLVSDSGSNLSGLAVITQFAKEEGSALQSGIVRTSLLAVPGTVGTTSGNFRTVVEFMRFPAIYNQAVNLASSGMTLCVEERGGGQKAEIKIAVESQRLATSTTIEPTTGVCA